MNNKGFAISTMLYGLSIVGLLLAVLLVQTISTSRIERSKLVESIEGEFNQYDNVSKFYSYDSRDDDPDLVVSTNINPTTSDPGTTPQDQGIRKFQLPVSGWYKVELWSSATCVEGSGETIDGCDDNSYDNGNGGRYTSVTLYLEGESTFYVRLGTPSTEKETRATTLCLNKEPKCTTAEAIASSEEYFNWTTKKTLTDTEDKDIVNELGEETNYIPQTNLVGEKMNLNNKGMARISLVSIAKPGKYNPKETPGNDTEQYGGAYYIIDAYTGKALAYNSLSKSSTEIGNRFKESLAFFNHTGSDIEKWRHNPSDDSFINIRTGYSLMPGQPIKNGTYVGSTGTFSGNDYEKWEITEIPRDASNIGENDNKNIVRFKKYKVSKAEAESSGDGGDGGDGGEEAGETLVTETTYLPLYTIKNQFGSDYYYLYHDVSPDYPDSIRIHKTTTDKNVYFYIVNAF